jgi:putative transposase
MFSTHRKAYNICVDMNRKKIQVTRPVVKNKLQKSKYHRMMPYKIFEESVRDFDKALKNVKAKNKEMKESTCKKKIYSQLHFKSFKAPKDSIAIVKNKTIIKENSCYLSIFPTILKAMGPIKMNEKVFSTSGIRIAKCHGFYYVCVNQFMKKEEDDPETCDIVAIDPGVRTFGAFYSEKMSGQVGIHTQERFKKIFKNSDNLRSKVELLKNKLKKLKKGMPKRKMLMKRLKHLSKKFDSTTSKPTRLVKELHTKTALFYCKNFSEIVIPEFSSKKTATGLYKYTNRVNYCLSHYKFRQVLYHTAKRLNRKVHIFPESFTSKTCTCCGFVNEKNSDEELTCSSCHLKMNRDLKASRNIFIRFLDYLRTPDRL